MSPPETNRAKSRLLPCGRRLVKSGAIRRDSEGGGLLFEKLKLFVERKNLNHSHSRELTLEVILLFKEHFSISDLVRKVQQRHAGIGAATVYRNIPLFVEAQILRESFSDKNGQPFYEVEQEQHHDHIVCLDCNTIFEFRDETIETAQDRVSSKLNFRPASHKHVIYAHCQLLPAKVAKAHKPK